MDSWVITMISGEASIKNRNLKKKLLWDYDISLEEYFDYLYGRKENGWLNQQWALLRAINNLNYYEFRELVPLELVGQAWDEVCDKIRDPAVKKGLEFLLQRKTVSTPG